MFGRWRKSKEEAGITCPLCSEVSPDGTEECPKCYHQLGKSIIDQDESVSEEVSTSIFDELLAEDEDGDDGEVVDWSKHTFEIDDVTIDVSQYEEDSEAVALSAAPNFAAIEADAPSQVPKVPKVAEELEDGEYELSTSDAPKNVEKFVVPTSKEVETVEEPTHQVDLVVPLLPKGATESSTEDEPLSDPSEVPEEKQETSSEDNSQPIPTAEAEPVAEPVVVEPVVVPTPTPVPTTTPETPATTPPALPATPQVNATPAPIPTPVAKPEIPKLPSLNSAASNGAVATKAPALPSVPTTPALPTVPSSRPDANAFKQDAGLDVDAESPSVTPPSLDDQMWPWPQGEPYDDLIVKRKLRQVMESVKGGDLDGAARDLDKLGPHLGDRKEILFHVGVVLKKLGREEALRRMLETARRLHPEDQHVATALTSLGM